MKRTATAVVSKDKAAAKRRMTGRYTPRLSSRRAAGSPRAFRAVPEYYRLAIESLKEYALISLDKELKIISWSGPAKAMFGYEESDVIGRGVSLLFTPEDISQGIDESEFATALKNGREDDERWHVRKDGRRVWCYGLSFPLRDDKGVARGFVKLIRDDTERKVKNDLLRENEERLSLAAESTGLGTWDYDPVTRSLKLSERAAKLFALGDIPAAPGFEQLLERIHPEDRPRISEELMRCLGPGKKDAANLEYRVIVPGGGFRWVHTRARAFYAAPSVAGDKPDRLIGTVVDISERKRQQFEAKALSDELEAKVLERTSRLTAVNKELETFAYSASHDLRAPVRKIAAYAQAILESGQSELSPSDSGYFERIRAAAGRMERLIDDILSLARVTRHPIKAGQCDLSATARSIMDEFARGEPHRKVRVLVADGAVVQGDCELLAIALRNLLGNAWKFTGKREEARIEFGVEMRAGSRVFFVKDDGAGFDMRFAGKLFGAFQRLHREDEFPGTGVGLGIVERVVRRHLGRIWAEAEVGKGAAFFFTIGTEAP